MTQEEFARAVEIRVYAWRNWEQRRRKPEGPAIALMRIAARHSRIFRDNLEIAATAASVARSLGDDVTADAALHRIAKGLESHDPEQRLAAVEHIDDIGGEAALNYLEQAVQDPDEEVRKQAQSSLEWAKARLEE